VQANFDVALTRALAHRYRYIIGRGMYHQEVEDTNPSRQLEVLGNRLIALGQRHIAIGGLQESVAVKQAHFQNDQTYLSYYLLYLIRLSATDTVHLEQIAIIKRTLAILRD
jgi:hypothetical protein